MSVAGIEVKAAARRTTAWGTALACGANHGILILSDSFKKDRPNNIDDSLGLYYPQDSDAGEISVNGDLAAYLRYDSLDLLIALAMGSTAGVPVQQGGTAAYQQRFIMTEHNDGLFGVIALHKKVNIEEMTSAKIIGFTLSGEVGKPVNASFHCIANNKIANSAVNTTSSFNNVTYFETANRVMFNHAVFRMNAQAGAALGSGDIIYPSSFELTYKRTMEGVYGAGGTFDTIDEPRNNGLPETTLKLEFPRYSSAAHFTNWDSGAAMKMDIVFTGALIAGAFFRRFTIELPNLKYASVDAPTEVGRIKHPVEFNCLGCATAPTGMTGITRPFQVTVINRQTANVLA